MVLNDSTCVNDNNVVHIVRDLRESFESLSLQTPTPGLNLHHPALDPHHHDSPWSPQHTSIGSAAGRRSELPGTLVCSEYPLDLARAAARLPSINDHTDQEDFFRNVYLYRDFWCKVMSYFFPPEAGFTISHNCTDALTSERADDWSFFQPCAISFVIKHSNTLRFPPTAPNLPFFDSTSQRNINVVSSDLPLALINICSPLDFPSSLLRDFAVHASQQRAEEVAASGTCGKLLVITTMGRAWRAQKRILCGGEELWSRGYHSESLDLTSVGFNSDKGMADSEWMEDVMSEPSWEILVRMCDDVKLQLQMPRVFLTVSGVYVNPISN